MKYLSLCSGIEAATVAWHPMGWEPVGFAEIESFPAAILKHRYPNVPNYGDMTKWREWNIEPGTVDLLVGGTPCQSFSVAGLRKGLSDPRGGLMLTFLEIAQSLRPRWVVWENVPGVLSSGAGRDFGSFLGALGELGYGWAYRVLDAQWCRVDGYERAVPQRRRRVFVVGCLGDSARAAQVLFERQSVARNPAPRGKARQAAAADAAACAPTVCSKWSKQSGGPAGNECGNLTVDRIPLQQVVGTLCADDHKGHSCNQTVNDDKLIVETADVYGISGNWIGHAPENGGNATQPMVGVSPNLTSTDRHAVAVNVSNGEPRVSDVAGTLDAARESRGSNQQRFIMEPFRKSHRASSPTDDESWVNAETANTLNRFDTGERDTHAIAFTQNQREEVRELGPVTGALSGQGTHQTTYIAATIDMQACKGNANIGDGSVSPTLCKPSGSDVHAVAIDLYTQAIDGDCAATLTAACGGPNTSGPKVMQSAVAFTCKDHGADASEVSPTLRAMPHDGSHANGGGQVAVAHGFYSTGGTHGVNMEPEVSPAVKVGSGLGIPSPPAVAFPIDSMNHIARRDDHSFGDFEENGPSYTITKGHSHAVAHTLRVEGHDASEDGTGRGVPMTVAFTDAGQGQRIRSSENESETLRATKRGPFSDYYSTQTVAPSLTASNDSSRSPQSAEVTQQVAAVHQATMVVRRLTPVECERLQGFPDGYTNIPWRGKSESPDGPRYKALGNSMAVNCMRWIGRRIDAVEKGTELPP